MPENNKPSMPEFQFEPSTSPITPELKKLQKDMQQCIKSEDIVKLNEFGENNDIRLISNDILNDLVKSDMYLPYLEIFLKQFNIINTYVDVYNLNLLSRAIKYNANATASAIIKKYPDLIHPSDTLPPLNMAIDQLNIKLVRELLDNGANPEFTNQKYQSPPLECLLSPDRDYTLLEKIGNLVKPASEVDQIRKLLEDAIAVWNKSDSNTVAVDHSDEVTIVQIEEEVASSYKPNIMQRAFKYFTNLFSWPESENTFSIDKIGEGTPLLAGNDSNDAD